MMPMRGSGIESLPGQAVTLQAGDPHAGEPAQERVGTLEADLQVMVREPDELLLVAVLEHQHLQLAPDLRLAERPALRGAQPAEARRPPPDLVRWHARGGKVGGLGAPAVRVRED